MIINGFKIHPELLQQVYAERCVLPECLGACCGAPAMQVNYDYYEDLTPQKVDKLIEQLKNGGK